MPPCLRKLCIWWAKMLNIRLFLTLNCIRYPALPLVHKGVPWNPPKKNTFPPELFNYLYTIVYTLIQGRSQPHSPAWARVPLSSFFPQVWIKFSYFSSNFSHFLPHFDPPGGQVAHPGRPWLRHCTNHNHISGKKYIKYLYRFKMVAKLPIFISRHFDFGRNLKNHFP